MMFGSLDLGTRLTAFRYFTGGFSQTFGSVNIDQWKRYFPMMGASFLTCWIMAPLEVAREAYFGDRTFPKELRKGYNSIPDALFKLAKTDPYALFKNSLPTAMASFVQTSFLLGIFDYLFDLVSPTFRDSGYSLNSVKTL